MIAAPYVGQTFPSGTKLIRVETLRLADRLDPNDGGEFLVQTQKLDGTKEIWYCTLLDGAQSYSYWPDTPMKSAIVAAFPHGTSEGRAQYESAKQRIMGRLYVPPSLL